MSCFLSLRWRIRAFLADPRALVLTFTLRMFSIVQPKMDPGY